MTNRTLGLLMPMPNAMVAQITRTSSRRNCSWFRERSATALLAVAGLGLTLLAAAVQRLEIGLAPVGLSHNALYHAIQAVALLFIYLGAAPLARASGVVTPRC